MWCNKLEHFHHVLEDKNILVLWKMQSFALDWDQVRYEKKQNNENTAPHPPGYIKKTSINSLTKLTLQKKHFEKTKKV